MEIVYSIPDLERYLRDAVVASDDAPVLLDRFLDQAVEVDVDCVSDGQQVVIGAIMQHIEQAGVHSGDSACSLPPYSLSKDIQDEIRDQVKRMAVELGVVGLMNVQMAVQGTDIYVIEVNLVLHGPCLLYPRQSVRAWRKLQRVAWQVKA